MKTIKEWLNELPESIRREAFNNEPKHISTVVWETPSTSMYDAIMGAFVWKDTLQGHDYWARIAESYNGDMN